jgi:hypothetical protein
MIHLLAPLALGALCVVWYLAQRGSGRLGEPPCGGPEPGCEACARSDGSCAPELHGPDEARRPIDRRIGDPIR